MSDTGSPVSSSQVRTSASPSSSPSGGHSIATVSDTRIPALVVRSICILGYKEYIKLFFRPTAFSEIPTPTSFIKTNEKLLLVLMHFLLCIVDPSFKTKCAEFWPYEDAREKNEFKRVAQEQLTKLVAMKILDHSDCRASTLTVAKGYAAWMLLWRLSNAALDSYLLSESIRLDVSGRSVDDIQAMAKEQIHLMNDELESTREKVHNRQVYALEMEGRLKAAVEKIEFHKSRLRVLGASPNGAFLTSQAKLERSEMVVRIKSTTALLKTLADSVGGISTAACDQQQASSGNYICDSVSSTFAGKTSAKASEDLRRAVHDLAVQNDYKQRRRIYDEESAGGGGSSIAGSAEATISAAAAEGAGIFSSEELSFIRSKCAAAAIRSEELLQKITTAIITATTTSST